MSDEYQCVACGRSHEGLPLSFAADSPDVYANMNRDERDVRSVRGSDQYIIDQKWFFIRGCLEIPIYWIERCFSMATLGLGPPRSIRRDFRVLGARRQGKITRTLQGKAC